MHFDSVVHSRGGHCFPTLRSIFQVEPQPVQDENRHGDFFTAILKSQPQFINDWQVRTPISVCLSALLFSCCQVDSCLLILSLSQVHVSS